MQAASHVHFSSSLLVLTCLLAIVGCKPLLAELPTDAGPIEPQDDLSRFVALSQSDSECLFFVPVSTCCIDSESEACALVMDDALSNYDDGFVDCIEEACESGEGVRECNDTFRVAEETSSSDCFSACFAISQQCERDLGDDGCTVERAAECLNAFYDCMDLEECPDW